MTDEELYITRFSAWALGIEGVAEWNEWAMGRRQMSSGREAPDIAFTDSMFRRRLSQISKMTIQVVHSLLPLNNHTKMLFLSLRGEISMQYKINKMQIEEGALMPAAFSLSVFNAPAALATMALGLKGGYSAVYPGGNSISSALITAKAAAEAAFITGKAEELVVVYADEDLPPEYSSLMPECHPPLAFSFVLSNKPEAGAISLSSMNLGMDSPADFLKSLLLSRGNHVSS